MHAAEVRTFRVSAGSVIEAIMVRAAGNVAETTEYFTVPAGKVWRLVCGTFTTLLHRQVGGNTVIRVRLGQTLAGEVIFRYVMPDAQSASGNLHTPFRVDGGANGQDLVLTVEQPQAGPAPARATALLIAHRD
jgi:hypothetical protein